MLLLAIVWLAISAPVSRTAQPVVPAPMTLLAAGGQPIARDGAIIDRPVDVTQLPPHVAQAFMAIEDRNFYSHIGISARGLTRAMWNNLRGGGAREGGSTITQQLAKITYLSSDRTMARKGQELLIAFWLEAWLSKDEIMSRYLSNAYFGDNVYGLRAASLHYFYRQPERLTLTQAAMLAGLVKAPSRLAPTRNLRGARDRERVVLGAMVAAGYLTEAQRRATPLARIDNRAAGALPRGTYFADWANPQARAAAGEGYTESRVTTTLDARLQRIATRVTGSAGLGGAQVALVAMRPDGSVVAMIGGRSHRQSPFNRATQAMRQPGSTFKLFVYLAALRSGMTPDSMVDDSPITEGEYRPVNANGRYRGQITLREAFAQSSNVVAVRLYRQLGSAAVAQAARDLGITTPIEDNASSALGSSTTTLLRLTSAYAAIAGDYGPVEPHALPVEEAGVVGRLFDGRSRIGSEVRAHMLDLLSAAVSSGTGRAARLAIPAYGKTGTSQNNRDALFVGFAGDLVVGVWIGNDDGTPLRGINGGGLPARIWRDFMAAAVPGAAPRPARRERPAPEDEDGTMQLPVEIRRPEFRYDPENGIGIDTGIGDLDVRIDGNGVTVGDEAAPDKPPAP